MNIMSEITPRSIAALAADWLGSQRWFAGKQRVIAGVHLVQAVTLSPGKGEPPPLDAGPEQRTGFEPRLEHLVIEVQHADRHPPELYQLLVGVRTELPQRLRYAEIGRIDSIAGPAFIYDAVHDPDAMRVLLRLLSVDATVENLEFEREPEAVIKPDLLSRPVQAEQSHTSVVFGEAYILKLFRRLHHGASPDLELHRALREVGSLHIAQPYAAFEGVLAGDTSGEPTTLGLLQEFFQNSSEGWGMAVASVRDLISETDARADRAGGDFAAESHRLGQAVATVHGELVKALGSDVISGATLSKEMIARLTVAVEQLPQLAQYAPKIRAIFTGVARLADPIRVQRVHGDLHLGQTLRTLSGWVLIDFEGEPIRTLAERRRMASPLQDVAGMLRSFDYAAHHLLLNWEGDAELQDRGAAWVKRNRSAFLDGYSELDTGCVNPREHPVLLRALELDKAIYEVGYELNHRPSWAQIPFDSIGRLVE